MSKILKTLTLLLFLSAVVFAAGCATKTSNISAANTQAETPTSTISSSEPNNTAPTVTTVSSTVTATSSPVTATPTPEVKISYPLNSSFVNIQEIATGTAKNIQDGQKLWILVYPLLTNKFYPQNGTMNLVNGEWSIPIYIGAKENVGDTFKIVAVLADQDANIEFTNYVNTGNRIGSWPGINMPIGAYVVDQVTVKRKPDPTSPLNTV